MTYEDAKEKGCAMGCMGLGLGFGLRLSVNVTATRITTLITVALITVTLITATLPHLLLEGSSPWPPELLTLALDRKWALHPCPSSSARIRILHIVEGWNAGCYERVSVCCLGELRSNHSCSNHSGSNHSDSIYSASN